MILSLIPFTIFSFFIEQPQNIKLNAVRSEFHSDNLTEKQLLSFIDDLKNNANGELLGYRGVCKTMMAKHVFWPTTKLEYFNDGKKDIALAIKENPHNIELIYLRLIVQLNAPNILGYNENIKNDLAFFQASIHRNSISSKWKITFINALLKSERISEDQKASLTQTKITLSWKKN